MKIENIQKQIQLATKELEDLEKRTKALYEFIADCRVDLIKISLEVKNSEELWDEDVIILDDDFQPKIKIHNALQSESLKTDDDINFAIEKVFKENT